MLPRIVTRPGATAAASVLSCLATRPSPTIKSRVSGSSLEGQNQSAAAVKSDSTLSASQLSILQSGGLSELQAAGLSDEIARQLIAGRAYSKMRERMRALNRTANPPSEYWKNAAEGVATSYFRQLHSINRDLENELRAGWGDDESVAPNFGFSKSFLSADKRESIRRIDQDYSDMESAVYAEMSGFPLPGDQEKLKLLQEEKRRDVVAVLTPAELEQFDLRSSQTALNIRNSYGEGIKSEADYKKIFALQKAFDDEYNRPYFGTDPGEQQTWFKSRMDAERTLQDTIRRQLGETAYSELRRSSDQDLRSLKALEKRMQLPAGTAETAYAARDRYAAQSVAISRDSTLTVADRRAKVQALAQQATADVMRIMGSQAGEIYGQRSGWISTLKSGTAFSLDAKDAQPGMPAWSMSFFPVNINPPPAPAKPKSSNP